MLVLTRKLHEQITVGPDITITVLRIKGNTVRIGIEAPSTVRVVRGELPRMDGPLPSEPGGRAVRRPTGTDAALRKPPLKSLVRQVGQRRAAEGELVSLAAVGTELAEI